MAIPEPIETFLQRIGFEYSTVARGSGNASGAAPAPDKTRAPDPEWITTVAFVGDHGPLLAVVPDGCRVDPARLRHHVGSAQLRPATAVELGALYSESEAGAMPPLGPLYGQPVFVDEQLARRRYVVFSGGTHRDAIRMRYVDFAELVHPIVARFAVPA